MTKNLWEIDHPYYCNEGNYFTTGQHEQYPTWEAFLEEWGGSDNDLNLVFRWDWYRTSAEDATLYTDAGEEVPGDELRLYYMMQRKARNMSVYVKVTEADQPAVRAFLTDKAETMRKVWEPLL